jgi:hypothetical protein
VPLDHDTTFISALDQRQLALERNLERPLLLAPRPASPKQSIQRLHKQSSRRLCWSGPVRVIDLVRSGINARRCPTCADDQVALWQTTTRALRNGFEQQRVARWQASKKAEPNQRAKADKPNSTSTGLATERLGSVMKNYRRRAAGGSDARWNEELASLDKAWHSAKLGPRAIGMG